MMTRRLRNNIGEDNTLSLRPRSPIGCLADDPIDLVCQVIAARAIGISPLAIRDQLPEPLQSFVHDWDGAIARTGALEALLIALPESDRVRTKQACAARAGPIVAIVEWRCETEPVLALWRLMREFAESVNTAAAGGNASLMTLAD